MNEGIWAAYFKGKEFHLQLYLGYKDASLQHDLLQIHHYLEWIVRVTGGKSKRLSLKSKDFSFKSKKLFLK